MAANINYLKGVRFSVASVVLCLVAVTANAGLFEDADARNAILNLRERVEATRLESEQGLSRAAEDRASIRQSLLELHNQIETLRLELANFRGLNEKLARDMADTQLRQKDITSGVNERLRQFEPEKVVVDGHEFMVEPAEKRDFETALAVFRKGDFSAAQPVFVDFLKRYPDSGYGPSALFWLGNAQYATRNYKEAVVNFRDLIARAPEHLRAPEAVLSIANCQVELKDARNAKKTLEDLVKAYPKSEAAIAAKERLTRLK